MSTTNREEYLQELYGRLSNRMPRQELDSTMQYYEEYFDEAGPQREAEIIEELGPPAALAAQILGRTPAGGEYQYAVREKRHWETWQVVLLVCLSPIWFPVLCGLFAAVIGLIAAALMLVVAVAAGGVIAICVGVVTAWSGFTQVFQSIPTAIFFFGLGLVAAGLGLLLLLGAIALGGMCCKGIGAFFGWIFGRNRRVVPA